MASTPETITVNVRFQFSQGHDDPKTLPQWMYDQFPTELLGYVINGYLAGIEVGRLIEKRNRVILAAECPACDAPPGVWCTFREPGAPDEFAHQGRRDRTLGDDAGRVPETGGGHGA